MLHPDPHPHPPTPSPEEEPGEMALVEESITLAAQLAAKTFQHTNRSFPVAEEMRDPECANFLLVLADEILRLPTSGKAAGRLRHLISTCGVPAKLPVTERLSLRLTAWLSRIAPSLARKQAARMLTRRLFPPAILDSSDTRPRVLQASRKQGKTVLLSKLGAPVLGAREADKRLLAFRSLLQEPEVTHLCIDLAAFLPSRTHRGFEEIVLAMATGLQDLLKEAGKNQPAKKIDIAASDPSDLQAVAEAFRRVLDSPPFHSVEAGIRLFADHPESEEVHKTLCTWALARREAGRAPIRLTLVGPDNILTTPDSAGEDTPLLTQRFARLLRRALAPETAQAAKPTIATLRFLHLAYALRLAERRTSLAQLEIEVTAGPGDALATVLHEQGCPVSHHLMLVRKEERHLGTANVLRRLTHPEITAGTPMEAPPDKQDESPLVEIFRKTHAVTLHKESTGREEESAPDLTSFQNIPLAQAPPPEEHAEILTHLESLRTAPPEQIPFVVGARAHTGDFPGVGIDPSRPSAVAYTFAFADDDAVERAFTSASQAGESWNQSPLQERRALLFEVAKTLVTDQAHTTGSLVLDLAFTLPEATEEISHAIDSARYYARAFDDASGYSDIEAQALGVVLVAGTWDTPYALPCGDILAALMAGNAVIFRPANDAVLAGWQLVNTLWKAGIPRALLQFLPTADRLALRKLLAHKRSGATVLAGAGGSLPLQHTRPHAPKRGPLRVGDSRHTPMVVTAAADTDHAIADVVLSAFTRSGQHPDSLSLLLVEAPLYDSETFQHQLKDATLAFGAGDAWEGATGCTALVQNEDPALHPALTTLDKGESWLLKPQPLRGPRESLWSPGIRLGVSQGSPFFSHRAHGPVLGVMRVAHFKEALNILRALPKLSLASLHSLDPREAGRWLRDLPIGELRVNAPLIHARPGRLPTRGAALPPFGPGAHAGTPHYVSSFCHWEQSDIPGHKAHIDHDTLAVLATMKRWLRQEIESRMLDAAARSYRHYWEKRFTPGVSLFTNPSERTLLHYSPLPRGVLLRLRTPFQSTDLAGAVLAAIITGTELELSLPHSSSFADALGVRTTIEAEDQLAGRLATDAGRFDLLRLPQSANPELFKSARDQGLAFSTQAILANGLLELPQWLREQVVVADITRMARASLPAALGIPSSPTTKTRGHA